MTKRETTTRKTCRICGGKLHPLFSLGDIYISDFIKDDEEGIKAPLELVICKNKDCELVQLKHTAPQEILYTRYYWYESAINQKIVDDLRDIAGQAMILITPRKDDVFLDIGANDGTLLGFVPFTMKRVACEPAVNLQEKLKQHADIVIDDFWSYKAYKKLGLPKAKIITAIGMFYDMEDPNQFIGDVAKALDDTGIFISQLMTLRPMMESYDLGNICHEHLEYYSYKSLVKLFEQNGLEIFNVEENDINGGSYRIFARKLVESSVEYLEKEYTDEDFKNFERVIQENGEKAKKYITTAVHSGKTVYGYGASTKGNTMLQYYGIDGKILSGMSDKNQLKFGKLTVGTRIRIIDEKIARRKADVFFILPWAFTDKFVEQEQEWRDDGGKFIVTIPKFKVI